MSITQNLMLESYAQTRLLFISKGLPRIEPCIKSSRAMNNMLHAPETLLETISSPPLFKKK